MYKIWMALSNIVSIVALLNIIKHHRIIIHHDSTTLKSHSTTHIYHRSSAHCLFNHCFTNTGKTDILLSFKNPKTFAWIYCMVHIYENWRNLTEFNKFYSSDINRYQSFKLFKNYLLKFYHIVLITYQID